MRISIAMATYNGAKYLEEQLNSFVTQIRQPHELVVCDDGSTDSTLEILESFRKQAPFEVRICINEKNLGYTKNFEKAISNCSGDLIFLSDQDDIWYPPKISVIEKAFLDHPDRYLVVHDGDLVDENLVSHGATKLGQVVAGYGTTDSLVTGALTAFRGELMQYVLPIPDGIAGHDGWLHNIARLLNTRFVLDQPLQLLRRHSANTSSWAASSPRKINRIDIWKIQFYTPAANGYEDRILINESGKARLKTALSKNNIFSSDAIENSLCYLTSELRALQSRNGLLKASPLKRKIMAIQLLLSGGYKYFNGTNSFLRDITR